MVKLRAKKAPVRLDVMGHDYTLESGRYVPQRSVIDTTTPGDYGADPIGDAPNGVFSTFRMVPSGDIVSLEEMRQRLARTNPQQRNRTTVRQHPRRLPDGTRTMVGKHTRGQANNRTDGREWIHHSATYVDPSAAHEFAMRLETRGAKTIVIRPTKGHYIVSWMERSQDATNNRATSRRFQLVANHPRYKTGLYKYGPATIWINGGGELPWWATARLGYSSTYKGARGGQEKDFDAATFDAVMSHATRWVDEVTGSSSFA